MTVQKLQRITKQNKHARLVHFPNNNEFIIFENNTKAIKSKEVAVFNDKNKALSYWKEYIKKF